MAIKFSEMEEKTTALDYEDLACVSEFDAMREIYTTKKIKISSSGTKYQKNHTVLAYIGTRKNTIIRKSEGIRSIITRSMSDFRLNMG